MSLKRLAWKTLHGVRVSIVFLAVAQFAFGLPAAQADGPHDGDTVSPIKHVIVIIGENRSFDHVFATYVPKRGQSVNNLLSEGIIKLDPHLNAIPGPNFRKAEQLAASDLGAANGGDPFLLSPPKSRFPNDILPSPLVGGPSGAAYVPNECAGEPELQCGASLTLAMQSENGLPTEYYPSLLIGGAGLPGKTPDTRITDVNNLPPGPFQLTNGSSFVYTDYAASPVHRFYQMWQQENCSLKHASWENPSGCNAKLFSWVEVTVGAGTNGATQPPLCLVDGGALPCFATNYLPEVPGATVTGEGSTALGFYNVQQGDAPYFKSLADNYAMSDNFHQSVDGGTGANHIMFGHGDMIYFSDGNGHAVAPPNGVEVAAGTPNAGVVSEIENPNPAPGTNNWYAEDGYGAGSKDKASSGGGSYSDCSDSTQPGVGPLVAYLHQLHINPNCEPGHYYLLNNYNPGYFGNGANAFTDPSPANTVFTVPPSSVPSIGDDLLAHNVSWKYYGDDWDAYSGAPSYAPQPKTALNPNGLPGDPYEIDFGPVGSVNPLGATIQPGQSDEYCTICNPFQYDTSIMANSAIREAHIQDTANLYNDITGGTLPAVSIVKPSGLVDGHPASSKLDLFEGFSKKIVDLIQASRYANDTAIFITMDEGGGYYDSGYVQPLDFFGDGTRIIFLVVAPYLKPGYISHAYADHVSILKFIERNWKLPPVSRRSRDNFPNPITAPGNPYVPRNTPAISDLFDFFNFGGPGGYGGSR
ncbi:MAG TPA: alkaline phosphatase family protein [Candidatus Acidoferrum sp.]|nr:alkaline phosphatase family protein [Candidatus Acidoferrum sp.]